MRHCELPGGDAEHQQARKARDQADLEHLSDAVRHMFGDEPATPRPHAIHQVAEPTVGDRLPLLLGRLGLRSPLELQPRLFARRLRVLTAAVGSDQPQLLDRPRGEALPYGTPWDLHSPKVGSTPAKNKPLRRHLTRRRSTAAAPYDDTRGIRKSQISDSYIALPTPSKLGNIVAAVTPCFERSHNNRRA